MRAPAARGQCGAPSLGSLWTALLPSQSSPQTHGPAGRISQHHPRPEGGGLGPVPRGRGRCTRLTLGLLLLTHGGRTMPPGVEALDLPAWNGASGASWGPRGRSVSPRRPAPPGSPASHGPSPGTPPTPPPRAAFLQGTSGGRTCAPPPTASAGLRFAASRPRGSERPAAFHVGRVP